MKFSNLTSPRFYYGREIARTCMHTRTHAHTQASFPGLPEGSQVPPAAGVERGSASVRPGAGLGQARPPGAGQPVRAHWGTACPDTQRGTLAGFQPEPEMTALQKRENPAAAPDSGGFPTKGGGDFLLLLLFLSRQSPQKAHGPVQCLYSEAGCLLLAGFCLKEESTSRNHADAEPRAVSSEPPACSPGWLSLLLSRSVVSASLRPRGLQRARPPCPSPTPRAHSNSRPSSQ